MLNKIVSYILITAGIAALAASTSTRFMQWVSDKRNEQEAWWGVHKNVEGDLVGMSYLHRVDTFCTPRDYAFTKPEYPLHKADLYVWGDSYTWKIPDTGYAGIRNYKYGWRYRDNLFYRLDSSQVNILIIELTERYVRPYFSGTDIYNYVKKDGASAFQYMPYKKVYAGFSVPSVQELFNPYINQNLEYNLFNYNFINPVRQMKASLNYYWFHRASGDVVIGNSGAQLFLKETVEGERVENSYYPLQEGELQNLVHNINAIYDHYKAEGFDEVYISMIPNPATILQPEGYDQLIPLIENDTGLHAKIISVYSEFKQADKRIFRPGDTHWNNNGLQIWLAKVNKMLIRQNEQH